MSLVVDATHLGTPEAEWLGSGVLDGVEALTVPAAASVVVVAPHPDDEVLGAGGLLATLAGGGARVHLLAVTDGEGSHPLSPTVTRRQLAELRASETTEGLRRLGVTPTSVSRLGLPDGDVAARQDEVADAVAGLASRDGGRCVVLAPWARDGHRDHDACGRAARVGAPEAGAGLIEYLVWAWHWATPGGGELPLDRARRVDLGRRGAAAKRWASAAYRSQIRPLSGSPGDEVVLPGPVLRRAWRGFETVVVAPNG